MRIRPLFIYLTIVILAALALVPISRAATSFFQGFETDNSGWDVLAGQYTATRVASGTNGVPSKTGSFHAEAGQFDLDNDGGSAFTRWGGYETVFPTDGYITSVDVYLDASLAATMPDVRFDFSSAINNNAGSFRRDFVFNAGTDPTTGGAGIGFIISASNNAGRSNSFPSNPARDPFHVTTTGWYTLEHRFFNGGGVLNCMMRLLDSSGAVLHTWTLSDPSDTIATIGGHRYGWFASNEFSFLAFDNTTLRQIAPTAAATNISGRIKTSDGQPLAGVVLSLSGSSLQRTITDSAGFYQFANVETDGFYTVSPDRTDYSFSPTAQSFSLLANKTDADFTATAANAQTANPLDTEMFFVRQQYLDFLGREPDPAGLAYWSSQIENCTPQPSCRATRRIAVSAAFLIETEFQQTGSFVYRLYKAALGRRINYQEFSEDRQQVVANGHPEQSQTLFADSFVRRPEFIQKYQNSTSAESFVDMLLTTIWQASAADLGAERSLMIELYKTGNSMHESRASVLRYAIEEQQLRAVEYNRAFVLMQYFGYLQREPEEGGYQFWLNVLNNKEPGNYRGMVCAFVTSAEYQERFSSVVTHSNRECRQ
ncbi:MAG TPA: DUF4214 domain-containing protein [Pyrinomonadaceae bacterium]|jgi:hypothetical protein